MIVQRVNNLIRFELDYWVSPVVRDRTRTNVLFSTKPRALNALVWCCRCSIINLLHSIFLESR